MGRELAITSPDGKTRMVSLTGGSLSLGRSNANELCYPEDIGLSRQHMVLECDGDEWTVRDLGSKNGTFVNGIRVSDKRRLKPGDRIIASRVVLTYDPAQADANKTVFFDGLGASTPAHVTVATTLESLLKREGRTPRRSSARARRNGEARSPRWCASAGSSLCGGRSPSFTPPSWAWPWRPAARAAAFCSRWKRAAWWCRLPAARGSASAAPCATACWMPRPRCWSATRSRTRRSASSSASSSSACAR